MSQYPTAVDDTSTLYNPINQTTAAPLQTTLTANVLSGDTTIQVASTAGFASSGGVLRIGDETLAYTGKTSTTFTGCGRGLAGSTAAAHSTGETVKANDNALYYTAIHAALIAIQTFLGTAGSPNFADVAHGHAAGAITFSPTGAVAATTVQAAIAEIDSEKAALSHVHSGSEITSGTVAAARLPVMLSLIHI